MNARAGRGGRWGRLRDRSAWDVQDVLVGDIPLLPEGGQASFYARHGDVFAWACALGAMVMGLGRLASLVRERVFRREAQPPRAQTAETESDE